MAAKSTLYSIASNYWIKLLFQNTIGLLPDKLGSKINTYITRLVQGKLEEQPYVQEYRLHRSLRNIRLIREYTSFTLPDSNVLEFGTGWCGRDIALFHILGAHKITTIDHQRWLTKDEFIHQLTLIDRIWDQVSSEAKAQGISESTARKRLEQLLTTLSDGEDFIETLNNVGIKSVIHPKMDVKAIVDQGEKFDLFFSESVIQRIPRERLAQRVEDIAQNFLNPLAVFFHRTDQRDINTLEHVGNNRWALDYLKHSDFVFDTFMSGKFTSQNRLREDDFCTMFEANDVTMRYIESRCVEGDIERIYDMKLAKRFRDKSPEQNAYRCSLIIGVHKDPVKPKCVREVLIGTLKDVEG